MSQVAEMNGLVLTGHLSCEIWLVQDLLKRKCNAILFTTTQPNWYWMVCEESIALLFWPYSLSSSLDVYLKAGAWLLRSGKGELTMAAVALVLCSDVFRSYK